MILPENVPKSDSVFLQSVIDGVAEPIMVIGTDYKVKLMNKAAREFSLKHNEGSGSLLCHQVSHQLEKPCEGEHVCPLEQVRMLGQPVTVIHKHYKSDGEVRFVEILASPLYGADGTFQGIIESSRDITERKRVEEALQQSEEKYRMLIENIQSGVFIIQNAKIQYANETSARIAGYAMEEIIGRDFREFVAPEDLKMVADRYHRRMAGENVPKEYEFSVLHKDGKRVVVHMNVDLINYRGRKAAMGILNDITERKRAEEALRESEEKFRSIVEQSGDGIVLTDENGAIVEWNRAAEYISGLSRAEALGRYIWDIQFQMAPKERKTQAVYEQIKANLLELLRTGQSHYLNRLWETNMQLFNGTIRTVQALVFTIKTDKGFMLCGISRDITERKEAEEAIKRYAGELEEANRLKELFIDIMHHDLSNPLTVASGYIHLLLEDELHAKKRAYMDAIERSLYRAHELIENATKFSRLEISKSIELEDMDLKKVIENVIENFGSLAAKSGMNIENNIIQSMPLRANKIIEDVFANIVSNAIKYAPQGKRIVLESVDNGDLWIVKVKDFGEGIKDEYKTLVFERFRRMEKGSVKGSGLGLAIARKTVLLHKGRIWVEDNPEGGAVFVVEIPKHLN